MQPYTYLIGWSKHNLWYYGAKYGTKADPNNLWVKYFTSSKYVKYARLLYGEPDVVMIRRLFTSPELCKKWETTVLRRIKAVESDTWLNKSLSNGYPKPIKGVPLRGTGWSHSDSTKAKISKALKGKPRPCSEERKSKLKLITKEKRYNYNNNHYCFYHKTGETYTGTIVEFTLKYNLHKPNVYNMLYGKNKSVKGWKIKL